jgi:hypothetical protein
MLGPTTVQINLKIGLGLGASHCYSNGITLSIEHEVENNLLIIPSNQNLASEICDFVTSMK